MTETQRALRDYLEFPYHIKIGILNSIGVLGNINTRQNEHNINSDAIQFIASFKLKERFIYEIQLIVEERRKYLEERNR